MFIIGFVTSLYRKPTFSGLYSIFFSFMPREYKKGLLLTLLFRGFSMCTDWTAFHTELNFLKSIMGKNEFPCWFVDDCIKTFLNKNFAPKKVISAVEIKDKLRICLPYLGKKSLEIRNHLLELNKTYFKAIKLQVVFKSGNRLGDFFSFKDKIPLHCRSLVLYSYTCDKCNLVYYGKTKRHFKVRAFEHLGKSLRTNKPFTYNVNNNNNTAVLNHIHKCKNTASIDDFKIIGTARNDYFLSLKESLLIQKDRPLLNVSVKSMPLALFD